MAEKEKCSNASCGVGADLKNSEYVLIEKGTTEGGQDWSCLAGRTLCMACWLRFKESGAFEEPATKPPAAAAVRRVCAGCDKPNESRKFFQIEEGTTTGGHNWSSLAGSQLCETCYVRFKDCGSHIKEQRCIPFEKRCTSSQCKRPLDGGSFFLIEEGKATGGLDWSSLVGNVLCYTCHQKFSKRGMLDSSPAKRDEPVTDSMHRCANDDCHNPDRSSRFYKIGEHKGAGGQDWSGVAGKVLCMACYQRFKKRGTLKRDRKKPLPQGEKRCTYAKCDRPDESRKFYRIDETKSAGQRDWSSLAGHVLCHDCYSRFVTRGTLERSDRQQKHLPASQRQCSYAECVKPVDGRQYYHIEVGRASGGQNWSCLSGSILCQTCYQRYRRTGHIESRRKGTEGSAEASASAAPKPFVAQAKRMVKKDGCEDEVVARGASAASLCELASLCEAAAETGISRKRKERENQAQSAGGGGSDASAVNGKRTKQSALMKLTSSLPSEASIRLS